MRWHAKIFIGLFILLFHGSLCLADPSIEEIKKEAEKGDAEAQCSLGTRYAKGEGVSKDYNEALRWYKKSADQGYAGSQYNLGYFYFTGMGVAKDYGEAMSWYKKAAAQGFPYAHANLGNMYFEGIGAPRNLVKAYTHWKVAADLEIKEAEKMIEYIQESPKTKMSGPQIAEGERRAERILRKFQKSDNGAMFHSDEE